QCDCRVPRETTSVRSFIESRNRVDISGKSLSAARTSCTINFGCSAISLSRASISAWVRIGLPPAGGADDSSAFDWSASSALRRCLKSARGKSRNSPAIRKIAASRGSDAGSGASGLATRASTARSSCSISFPLAIRITQPHPQILQPAELKLLDTAFGASERGRDFANRLILRKPHRDHSRLIPRQPLDEFEQPRPPLGLCNAGRQLDAVRGLRKRKHRIALMNTALGKTLRSIGDLIGC